MTSNSTRASQYSKLDLINFEGMGVVAAAQWRDVDGPQNHGYVFCIWCPKFPPTISRMRGVAKFKLIQRILRLTTHNSTRTLLMLLCYSSSHGNSFHWSHRLHVLVHRLPLINESGESSLQLEFYAIFTSCSCVSTRNIDRYDLGTRSLVGIIQHS